MLCRLCIRDIFNPPVRDNGDQGDAPLPDNGGLLLPDRRQVRRHSEGKGAEKGPAAPDQPVEHVGRHSRHHQSGRGRGLGCRPQPTTVPAYGENLTIWTSAPLD